MFYVCKSVRLIDYNHLYITQCVNDAKDTYYLSFPRDRLAFKFLVYGTFAIEIAQSALVTHDTYVRIGKGFGSVGSLLEINLIWLSMAIFGGIGMSLRWL